MRKSSYFTTHIPTVLSIAASDSVAGAGIQADIRACARFGVFAMTAVTAVTSQNTCGVSRVHPVPLSLLRSQISDVSSDVQIDAIKIGMLPNEGIASAVAEYIRSLDKGIPVVIDPVTVSSSGKKLASKKVLEIICREIAPYSSLITPNLPEAREIARVFQCSDDETIMCRELKCTLLLKGGHGTGDMLTDRLVFEDGFRCDFTHDRIHTRNTHGTGCTLSSAIAANLAKGQDIAQAVGAANSMMMDEMFDKRNVVFGHGNGPALFLP